MLSRGLRLRGFRRAPCAPSLDGAFVEHGRRRNCPSNTGEAVSFRFFTSLGKTVTRFRALLFVRLEKLGLGLAQLSSGGIRTVFRRNNGNCGLLLTFENKH